MSHESLSDFDRDRVAVTLRRVGAVTRDLRREYPEAFEPTQSGSAPPEQRSQARATPSAA